MHHPRYMHIFSYHVGLFILRKVGSYAVIVSVIKHTLFFIYQSINIIKIVINFFLMQLQNKRNAGKVIIGRLQLAAIMVYFLKQA